jgi:3-oxoacyl-[acyl-carrier-protein] synthase-1
MSERPVSIASIGLRCALGETFSQGAAAWTEGERPFRRPRDVIGVDGSPITMAEAIRFDDARDYVERLRRLTSDMAKDAIASSASLPASSRILAPAWIKGQPVETAIREAIVEAARGFGDDVGVVFGSTADGLRLLNAGALAVSQGRAASLVVGAIDSFINAELLDALGAREALLTSNNPYGFVPGEAACALVLTASAGTGAAHSLGWIGATLTGREPQDVDAPTGLIGAGLSDVYRQALLVARPDRLISDLCGERWRAEEFGAACAAAGGPFPTLCERVEATALHAGNCGVANGLLGVAVALAGPPREAQPDAGPLSLVSASARSGERAATFILRNKIG